MNSPHYRRDMGDGLVLRWSTAADVGKIAELYGLVFRPNADAPPAARMGKWADDVGSGRHPSFSPQDFAVVEDTRSGAIVAALMVLRQTWSYDGVEFEIGRPESVASHPDYRNRGLVRGIFDLLHARSAARGQLAQGITGIAYFYRQFDYEYAVDLEGGRRVPLASIPPLKAGETEPYRLRAATIADLPTVRALYEREQAGLPGDVPLVTTTFDEAYWRWTLDGQDPESGQGGVFQLIVDQSDTVLGYAITPRFRYGEGLAVWGFSTAEGAPLVNMVPSVLRGLAELGKAMPPWREGPEQLNRIAFLLNDSHPLYRALPDGVVGKALPSYAWYVRVPDLPAFVRHIAPALERRLAESAAAGYTGDLRLDFYRGGLLMSFKDGKLAAAEPWRRPIWDSNASGGFPPLVFLQLLFCRRTLDDLMYAFPDVWADDTAALVLRALFPRRRSWAIGQD